MLTRQVLEYPSLMELLEDCKRQELGKQETTMRMRRYLDAKARTAGVPIRGAFELTPLCNLSCKMCYVHLSSEQLQKDSASVLSGDQWIEIIDQASDMGMYEATLTGGEALLHPDFDRIFLFMIEKNITVNLKTNGLMLTRERLDFLRRNHITSIQISLYGCDEESYERVTGVRGFSAVMDAIRRVSDTDIAFEVVILPSAYIWQDMEKLLSLVESLNVKYSVNPGLVDPLAETGRRGVNHDLTLDQYVSLNKMMAKQKGIKLDPVCPADVPVPDGKGDAGICGMKCAAGRSTFAVSWRGMLHPCRMLERIGCDLLQHPFADAWRQINQASKAYPYLQECVGCAYETTCPSCPVQHEMGADIGHANPSLCLRAQRFVAEGFLLQRKGRE